MLVKIVILLLFVPAIINPFIIQTTKLNVNEKDIILFSDLHLPELEKSKLKQKIQNKKIKKILKKSKKLIVFFEGYPEDQKNKFSKEQIKRSKTLCSPAYLDILTQTLKNKNVKIIPSDPRLKINNLFLSTVKALEILSSNSIDEIIDGTAKIKKLNTYEKMELKKLELNNPRLNKILSILQNHYTLVEKPYLDKLKTKINKLFDEYENSCNSFANTLLQKIIYSKDKKIMIFAGHEHIEKLKTLLLRNKYKIKNEIYDMQTIKFVQSLEKQLEGENLTDINNQLETKADMLKIPDVAFQII